MINNENSITNSKSKFPLKYLIDSAVIELKIYDKMLAINLVPITEESHKFCSQNCSSKVTFVFYDLFSND